MVGGLSAFGAALYSAGFPRGSVVQYEQAVKADGFLLIVHGGAEDLLRAQKILAQENPSRLDLHDRPVSPTPQFLFSAELGLGPEQNDLGPTLSVSTPQPRFPGE
jgi:hypothetical protein